MANSTDTGFGSKGLCKKGIFKLEVIKEILQSSLSSLKSDKDAVAFIMQAPKYQARDVYEPIVYGVDGFEYEAAICKNLRVKERREVFEVRLKNEFFFKRRATDHSFIHEALVAGYNQTASQSWRFMHADDIARYLDEIKFASLFGIPADFSVAWIYNDAVVHMELIISNRDNSRELAIILEPGYPIPPRLFSRIPYSELRQRKVEGNLEKATSASTSSY